MFLTSLEAKTSHLKIKPIILPCFSATTNILNTMPPLDLHIATGDLSFVSKNELTEGANKELGKFTYDWRSNHLSIPNHTILCNKLLDFITTGNQIDLNSDFKSNFLSAKEFGSPPDLNLLEMLRCGKREN